MNNWNNRRIFDIFFLIVHECFMFTLKREHGGLKIKKRNIIMQKIVKKTIICLYCWNQRKKWGKNFHQIASILTNLVFLRKKRYNSNLIELYYFFNSLYRIGKKERRYIKCFPKKSNFVIFDKSPNWTFSLNIF